MYMYRYSTCASTCGQVFIIKWLVSGNSTCVLNNSYSISLIFHKFIGKPEEVSIFPNRIGWWEKSKRSKIYLDRKTYLEFSSLMKRNTMVESSDSHWCSVSKCSLAHKIPHLCSLLKKRDMYQIMVVLKLIYRHVCHMTDSKVRL